jgi:hypothetical protein
MERKTLPTGNMVWGVGAWGVRRTEWKAECFGGWKEGRGVVKDGKKENLKKGRREGSFDGWKTGKCETLAEGRKF